jgi:hypothetical protein
MIRMRLCRCFWLDLYRSAERGVGQGGGGGVACVDGGSDHVRVV